MPSAPAPVKPYARRNTYGRTARRNGASVQGQLSTWVNSIVSQTTAERVLDLIGGERATAKEMGVTRTCPWSGSVRERYHTCPCCGSRWKSVETMRA